MMWTLSESAARVGGHTVGADVPFDSVGKDSRGDCRGQLFVALRGERFDGHDFVAQALQSGAVAALVDHRVDVDVPQWVVEDTRLALGQLAAAWRDHIEARVVAVTGSNGKTTCKEMIAAILCQVGSVNATQGNLNNDVGMPLTLLSARSEDYLVLEMGANHQGEIAYLTNIGRPSVAAITNAGRAHLEGFGSVEGVARAKGEIALGLPPDGTFVFPSDSPWATLWREFAEGRRVLGCGIDAGADMWTKVDEVASVWDETGFHTSFRVRAEGLDLQLDLALAGMHNVRNALIAVAVALVLGIAPEAIRSGLRGLKPVAGRLNPRLGSNSLRLIDDTYNANPDSVHAAIDVLVGLPGKHWMVLGDLGELGSEAEMLHRGIGETARASGVDALYTVGKLSAFAGESFGPGGRHFADQATLISDLRARLGPGDLVLVKGSRLAAMERVADALCGVEGA